jgi:hypothetical protein
VAKAVVVPLRRIVKQGMVGPDVRAIKRALARVTSPKTHRPYIRWSPRAFTPLAGPFFTRNVKRFQGDHGLLVDGEYGRSTHEKLVARRGFDRYGAWLMGRAPGEGSGKPAVAVSTALYAASKAGQIHYTQSEDRMWGVRNRVRPPRVPQYEDCASFVTWCYWVAGVSDPNGLGYNGEGWCGTLDAHGRRVSDPAPGDLVFYGWGPLPAPGHVAIYVGGGKVVSHGSEAGPAVLSLDYRSDRGNVRRYVG